MTTQEPRCFCRFILSPVRLTCPVCDPLSFSKNRREFYETIRLRKEQFLSTYRMLMEPYEKLEKMESPRYVLSDRGILRVGVSPIEYGLQHWREKGLLPWPVNS